MAILTTIVHKRKMSLQLKNTTLLHFEDFEKAKRHFF